MRVVRPRSVSDDKLDEIGRYLSEQWRRASEGRASQVDEDYARWDKLYRAIPREATRNFPWPNASNIVVPLIRMHLDTFVARTHGIVFATDPLIKLVGFQVEQANALEKYLNYKSLYHWGMYRASRDFLHCGNKNGTSVMKTPWIDIKAIDVVAISDDDIQENEIDLYVGPRPEVIPFDDFFVYPITATLPHHVQIKFHRLRYTGEEVKELCDSGKWLYPFEDVDEIKGLKGFLKRPEDVKRDNEQQDAGVIDPELDILQPVECHFRYPLEGGSKYYDLVVMLLPDAEPKIIDLYYNPYPRNIDVFQAYKPFPREGLWYGESMPQLLEQFQEECSAIHNDRRNNSFIANAPVFKRKSTSLVPNPGHRAWWPGKVFDVDSMDDFDVMQVGRNYDDMMQQESFGMSLAERVSGVGSVMQGNAQGMMGKRGIYNATGTLAIMAESNERQNTNIRDFRDSLSGVFKTCFTLQKTFQPDDPALAYFPEKDQAAIREAMAYATESRTHLCPFELRSSTAAMNKETERQSLMQMAGVLERYNGQLMQIGTQLLNQQLNPGLRAIYEDVLDKQRNFARRLLKAFDDMDPDGTISNIAELLQPQQPEQQQGFGADPLYGGGTEAPGQSLSRASLEGISQMEGLGS